PTIGYGHTLGVRMSDTITKSQAEQLLRGDLITAESEINKHNLNINQNQFDALVSFVFNIGVGNFRTSTLLKRLKHDTRDPDIEKQFKRWIYAGGKILNGLIKRRNNEIKLYFS
ncbi:MAG: lysozyme, partial [Bacteroidaceae bacterium]